MIERNAVIKSATITNDDHGILSAWLQLEYGNSSGPGFGGYVLYLPESFEHHTLESVAGHFIWRVMEIAEVDEWGNLPGKTIRVRTNSNFDKISAIGHIINDDWFDPTADFASLQEEIL